MQTLAERIVEHAESLPEGTPLGAKALLHLGSRAAVDQALSRLTRRGELMRAGRGVYFRPIKTRFGLRAPSPEKAVAAFAHQRGETVARHGVAAANALGLTTQVPVRPVYLTSGPSRKLKLGAQVVELKHAPLWKLSNAEQPAGEALRALAWLGPAHAREALAMLKRHLPQQQLSEMVEARSRVPGWLAEVLSSELLANG